MPSMSEIGRQAWVDAICKDRHSVVCIDDGGAGNHNLDTNLLVQDFHLFVAIRCSAASYIELTAAHENWLDRAREILPADAQVELHAVELVNPKSKSAWKSVPNEVRLQLMRSAVEQLLPHVDQILFGYIGDEQYRELLGLPPQGAPTKDAQLLTPKVDLTDPSTINYRYRDCKLGLELNFHKALASRLQSTGQTHVIMQDAGRLRANTIETIFEEGINIWHRSVLHLDSREIAGIQVADLVAWSINRAPFTQDRILKGKKMNPFCSVAREVRELIRPKCINVWDD
jgi:hypothetical protein